jgi:hypothetical protein
MADRSSRLRQRIRQTQQQYLALLDGLVDERGPLIRGSFGTRARVCGVPTCRCTRGELHESKYLSATDGGRVRQVHVPVSEEVEVAEGVARYRRFWRVRARMAELGQMQLDLVDDLGRSLLKPYPESRPLPAAKRRGRTPKEESRGPR